MSSNNITIKWDRRIQARLTERSSRRWSEFAAKGAVMEIEDENGKARPMNPHIALEFSGLSFKPGYKMRLWCQPIPDWSTHVVQSNDPRKVIYEEAARRTDDLLREGVSFKKLSIWANPNATNPNTLKLAVNTTYQLMIELFEKAPFRETLVSMCVIKGAKFRTVSSQNPEINRSTEMDNEAGDMSYDETKSDESDSDDSDSAEAGADVADADVAESDTSDSAETDADVADADVADADESDADESDADESDADDSDSAESDSAGANADESDADDSDESGSDESDSENSDSDKDSDQSDSDEADADATNPIRVRLAKDQEEQWATAQSSGGCEMRVNTQPRSIIPGIVCTVQGLQRNAIYRAAIVFKGKRETGPCRRRGKAKGDQLRTVVHRLKSEGLKGRDLMREGLSFKHVRIQTNDVKKDHQVRLALGMTYQPIVKIYEVRSGKEVEVSSTRLHNTKFKTESNVKNAKIRAFRKRICPASHASIQRIATKKRNDSLKAQLKKAQDEEMGSDHDEDDEDAMEEMDDMDDSDEQQTEASTSSKEESDENPMDDENMIDENSSTM